MPGSDRPPRPPGPGFCFSFSPVSFGLQLPPRPVVKCATSVRSQQRGGNRCWSGDVVSPQRFWSGCLSDPAQFRRVHGIYGPRDSSSNDVEFAVSNSREVSALRVGADCLQHFRAGAIRCAGLLLCRVHDAVGIPQQSSERPTKPGILTRAVWFHCAGIVVRPT